MAEVADYDNWKKSNFDNCLKGKFEFVDEGDVKKTMSEGEFKSMVYNFLGNNTIVDNI